MADQLAAQVPPDQVQSVWVFPAVRREDREWGTAIVARRGDGGRIRVYTARYVQVVRGPERGQGRVEIAEVAECPPAVVYDVLKGVGDRMAEPESPVEIPPSVWYAAP